MRRNGRPKREDGQQRVSVVGFIDPLTASDFGGVALGSAAASTASP